MVQTSPTPFDVRTKKTTFIIIIIVSFFFLLIQVGPSIRPPVLYTITSSASSSSSVCFVKICFFFSMFSRFRFYSTDSTFIHGGVDRPGCVEQPAVGPENISQRIQDLNLHDCHAKIRQVDSHPTIGEGVVVQVKI